MCQAHASLLSALGPSPIRTVVVSAAAIQQTPERDFGALRILLDATESPTEAPGGLSNVAFAFILVTIAGLCAPLGACIVFVLNSEKHVKMLPGALAFAAGVMIFVSIYEVWRCAQRLATCLAHLPWPPPTQHPAPSTLHVTSTWQPYPLRCFTRACCILRHRSAMGPLRSCVPSG